MRFEHAASRQDIYCVSQALIEQFIASFASAPESLILDLDRPPSAKRMSDQASVAGTDLTTVSADGGEDPQLLVISLRQVCRELTTRR